MFSIFKRRQRKSPSLSSPSWLQARQRKWADRLTWYSEKLNARTKRLFLVLFCICGLLYCSATIWRGTKSSKMIIAEPQQVVSTPHLPENGNLASDTALLRRLKIYKQKIDNLTPQERQKLIETRPGLLDSLQKLDAWMNKINE